MPLLPPEIIIVIVSFTVNPSTPFRERSKILQSLALISLAWIDISQAALLSIIEVKSPQQAGLLLNFIRKRSEEIDCLKSLSLSYVQLANKTGPPSLKSLSFTNLQSLTLRHCGLVSPALLLRPSTLPLLTSLTLRQSYPTSKSFIDAFASIAPQLHSLSLDLHKEDIINTRLDECIQLTLLRYFPTTSTANLLEKSNLRPLKYLQLDDKTGANLSAMAKAIAEIVRGFDHIALSRLEAIYLPESWNTKEEKELLRDICSVRSVSLLESDVDDIAMPSAFDRDYE